MTQTLLHIGIDWDLQKKKKKKKKKAPAQTN